MKNLTPLELTEEIKCFTSLRENLIVRKRKAEKSSDSPKGFDRALNLTKQLGIVERHLLQCFLRREELS